MFAALSGGAKAPTIDFKRVLQVVTCLCHLLEITCFQCFLSCQGTQVSSVLHPVFSHGEEVPV